MGRFGSRTVYRSLAELLLVTALSLGIGIIYTYPLILHLGTSLPVGYYESQPSEKRLPPLTSDTLQTYFSLWNFEDSVLHLQSPYPNPYEFAFGNGYRLNMWGFPLVIPFTVFSLVFGDLAAYNLTILATFPAAALAMYLFARIVTRSPAGAVVAATIWACNPWRLSKMLGGHVFGFLFFLPPLFLYFSERAFRRRSISSSIAAGATLAVLGLSLEAYIFLYFGILLILYLGGRCAVFLRDRDHGALLMQRLRLLLYLQLPVILGGLFLLSYAYFIFYRPIVLQTYGATRPIEEIASYSAVLQSFVQRSNADGERHLYLGIAWLSVPLWLLLSLRGAIAHVHQRKPPSKGICRCDATPSVRFEPTRPGSPALTPSLGFLVTLTALAGVLLSLGPNFDRITQVPLYAVLYHLPFIGGARVPTHAFLMTSLSISLLTAMVIYEIGRCIGAVAGRSFALTLTPIITSVAISAIFLDFWTIHGMLLYTHLEEYKRDPVLSRLRSEARTSKILFLPVEPIGNSSVEFYATITRTPAVNGYSPVVPSAWLTVASQLRPLNYGGQITAAQYETLRQLGVTDVVVDRDMFATEQLVPEDLVIASLRSSPYLSIDAASPHFWLFRVEPTAVPKPYSPPQIPPSVPVPPSARIGAIEIPDAPGTARSGASFSVQARLTNQSPMAWPGEASTSEIPVRLAPYWRPAGTNGESKINEGRAFIPRGIQPGETVSVSISVAAPMEPGQYDLYVQVLQENVSWFPLVARARVAVVP